MKRLSSFCTGTASTLKPQITSLIDVMTILLVFLMKSFSVEGNLITPSDDLTLPSSTSRETPEPVTTLEITTDALTSHGERITSLAVGTDDDSLELPPLSQWLARRNSGSRAIMLQADRRIPFSVIKRVMYTCSKSGFDDFTILVQQEG
ncbi:MAG: biopolymer transporter ExbD [Chitinispirillaceae bacterium]|nr:biopolymer transporter ExbD [Chitinispirillaceae bacterium]